MALSFGLLDERRDTVEHLALSFHEGEHKYIQIYKYIKGLIDNGQLQSGEKLPALRTLKEDLGVNLSTCVNAYNLLEKERYIYKQEGSGCYVYPRNNPDQPLTGDVLRFDLGHPLSAAFPLTDFRFAVEKTLENHLEEVFEYQEGMGYEPLRQHLVNYLKGLSIRENKDNIQIISGAQQGINLIARSLLHYGDTVFIEEPSYYGAMEVFKELKIRVVGVPLLKDGIDIGLLKQKLQKGKPKFLYVMPHYQNPTGLCYSTKKMKELIRLAQQHDFMILEDDSLSEISFTGEKTLPPLKSLDTEDRVIYIKSFSKILMPGLRIGLMTVPEALKEDIGRAKFNNDISTPALIQIALYTYMTEFDWEKHCNQVESYYYKKYVNATKIVDLYFKNIVEYTQPCGGHNYFMRLPKEYSGLDLKVFLAKRKIAILEGNLFNDDFAVENGFRISYAQIPMEKLEESFRALSMGIKDFLQDERNKIKYRLSVM